MNCVKIFQLICLVGVFFTQSVPTNGSPLYENNEFSWLYDRIQISSLGSRLQNEEDVTFVTADYDISSAPRIISISDPFHSPESFCIEKSKSVIVDIDDPNFKTYREIIEEDKRSLEYNTSGPLSCTCDFGYPYNSDKEYGLSYISPNDERIRLGIKNASSHVITGFLGDHDEERYSPRTLIYLQEGGNTDLGVIRK